MPIRRGPGHPTRKSRGFVPLQFFAGRQEHLNTLPVSDIVKAFHNVGYMISPEHALQLKIDTMDVVRSMIIKARIERGPRPPKRIRRKIASGTMKKIRAVKRISFFSLPVGTPAEKDIYAGRVGFAATLFPSGKLLIHQAPLLHGVTASMQIFDTVLKILKEGFQGHWTPNAYDLKNRKNYAVISSGDSYTLQIMAPRGSKHEAVNKPSEYNPRPLFQSSLGAFIKSAKPTQILAVNIVLGEGLSAQEIAEKKKFYQEKLTPFGIPFHFIKRGGTEPRHFEELAFDIEETIPY
ncbi:MAG: hypothetical protein HY392_01135 [Candidatus Diapherotrites archaeon]|nr:hypothetical protein [Candidatus Diapherotrites archaeon]